MMQIIQEVKVDFDFYSLGVSQKTPNSSAAVSVSLISGDHVLN